MNKHGHARHVQNPQPNKANSFYGAPNIYIYIHTQRASIAFDMLNLYDYTNIKHIHMYAYDRHLPPLQICNCVLESYFHKNICNMENTDTRIVTCQHTSTTELSTCCYVELNLIEVKGCSRHVLGLHLQSRISCRQIVNLEYGGKYVNTHIVQTHFR